LKIHRYERKYKRDKFDCGKEPLNNYIQKNATKDVKTGACTCFIIKNDEDEVIGYYTLSTESIPIEDAPLRFQKKIKYQYVPVILLGRLALDKNHFGKGLGKLLLVSSLKKSLDVATNYVGAVAVIVDPIDEEAQQYYLKYGFTLLPDSGRMFMSMKTIENAFAKN
jgi:predicted GNAT family N-acyltransferase